MKTIIIILISYYKYICSCSIQWTFLYIKNKVKWFHEYFDNPIWKKIELLTTLIVINSDFIKKFNTISSHLGIINRI